MRQHGLHALRAGFEGMKTEQRIEPYQPPAGSVKPVHLKGQRIVGVALEPIGNQQYHRALRENPARPSLMKAAQRRSDTSATGPTRPLAEQAASASSGSRWRIARVTLV